MDLQSLVHAPDKVRPLLKTIDDAIVTTKACTLCLPKRFLDRILGEQGDRIKVLGMFIVIYENSFYALFKIPAIVELEPIRTREVVVDEDVYMLYDVEAGGVVIANNHVVLNDELPYHIDNEFFAKGRVPFYLSYEELGTVYEDTPKYCGVKVGGNRAIIELIASFITRDAVNRREYYRHAINRSAKAEPLFIALRNIDLGATNTTAKLMGSYFDEGLNSALVHKSVESERLEELLRS